MTELVTLQAAARVAPLVSADRIKLARELRELTQQDLVRRTDDAFTPAALSQLERGKTRPTPATLAAIANATACPADFFVARAGDEPREGFFRSLRATSAKTRRSHLAQARLLHDFVTALEEHIDLPPLDLPRLRSDPTTGDVEAVANSVRRAWGLDDEPIPNVVRELERHGVVVVRLANFRREVDAFSVRYEGRPIVVLGSEKAVMTRSRFDAAHELAHLVLHEDADASRKEAEAQAHQFAAAFLMPERTIRRELPSTANWSDLMRLKTRWRVSMGALLRRAATLGVLPSHQYVNAMKVMSARGWRTAEPGDEKLGPLEMPVLLRIAAERLADINLRVADVAVEAGLPVDDIQSLLEQSQDPRPRVQL